MHWEQHIHGGINRAQKARDLRGLLAQWGEKSFKHLNPQGLRFRGRCLSPMLLGRGALGLLFICLPFTCVEVSAEKPAPPVAGPSNPSPHGFPAVPAKSTVPRNNEGGGDPRSLTARSLAST